MGGSGSLAGTVSKQTVNRARMVVGASSGHWKRPINRMYSYNYQVGENYYLPMTSYLSSKAEAGSSSLDLPGPLCFSERIASHPITGERRVVSSSSEEMVSSSYKFTSSITSDSC